MKQPGILLIYTGGTIGMVEDRESKSLKPFDFSQIKDRIPELRSLHIELSVISFDQPIDSSNMSPAIWIQLTKMIEKNYDKFDGFVILHGSDTMAFTASALSFLLENLNKPVILTGSQLPMGIVRTDGKENLITAIEIAARQDKGKASVPEVCIYFEYQLYRGNRTHKFNSEHFQAFQSANYPVLAEAGVHIKLNRDAIRKINNKKLKVHTGLNQEISVLKLFPGITENAVAAILKTKKLKAVVMETFGSGNAPTDKWFIELIKKAISRGILIYNITQCNAGTVEQGKYETSAELKKAGVIGGSDITYEAAITKLMFLFAQKISKKQMLRSLSSSLRGELTES
jgi:L-asparaginase